MNVNGDCLSVAFSQKQWDNFLSFDMELPWIVSVASRGNGVTYLDGVFSMGSYGDLNNGHTWWI